MSSNKRNHAQPSSKLIAHRNRASLWRLLFRRPSPQDTRQPNSAGIYGKRKARSQSDTFANNADRNLIDFSGRIQSSIEGNDTDRKLTNPITLFSWEIDTMDDATCASSSNRNQRKEMDINQRITMWKQNITKQVNVCPHRCLAKVFDRICFTKEPLNDNVLQPLLDYIRLPPKLANSVYQIALAICMIDDDNNSNEHEKNYRFRYFGRHFCQCCFNVLFMKSQPQIRSRFRKILKPYPHDYKE